MNGHDIGVHEVAETECAWFSAFFEKPLLKRVNLRIDIRTVKFWRST
jgi:hypothetical protein